MTNLGIHHVRVKNIGNPSQEIFVDGTPIEAPEGTVCFTGPGASLLELKQNASGHWVLVVDGVEFCQSAPSSGCADPPYVWHFSLPQTGVHEMRVMNISTPSQEVFIDGMLVDAPGGQMTFTGPGASLLELQSTGDDWALVVDGVMVTAGAAMNTATDTPKEMLWSFGTPSGSAAHELRILRLGQPDQEVSIDGVAVPAPAGQTAFTGPEGTLLELRRRGHAWALYVDGKGICNEDAETMSASKPVVSSQDQREAVAPNSQLPQGVSLSESGKYAANIRLAGKFKFLGEFSTPEEAHAKYLQVKAESSAN